MKFYGVNFLGDEEKMRDFNYLPKEEFLASYSYLTEAEYDNTAILYACRYVEYKIASIIREFNLPENYIEAYVCDNETIGIEIGGCDWANYLTPKEAYGKLMSIEKGLLIAKEVWK